MEVKVKVKMKKDEEKKRKTGWEEADGGRRERECDLMNRMDGWMEERMLTSQERGTAA